MLLVYSPQKSPRLLYICRFIFEKLGIDFNITEHKDEFQQHPGSKINYSKNVDFTGFQIIPAGLLNEGGVFQKNINHETLQGLPIIFPNNAGSIPFDIFSAAFFLLSRYEEYLPYTPDEYGRFPYRNSTAWRLGFLQRPVINEWINWFAQKLISQFPDIKIALPKFSFRPTYDIDMAWSYKNKGILRNLGGMIKKPSMERVAVLFGLRKDPFDVYQWLNAVNKDFDLDPIYFFLLAENRSGLDKNISPANPNFIKLLADHANRYKMGLHPSWESNHKPGVLLREKKSLESLIQQPVTSARQHYIKMNMPDTYRALTEAGITDDYSMGYGSINGFRASVAAPFKWYDLLKEEETSLTVHPFCFMDANSYYEQKQDLIQTQEELWYYLDQCKSLGGTLITIFHNSFLGTGKLAEGWRDLYTEFIRQVSRK